MGNLFKNPITFATPYLILLLLVVGILFLLFLWGNQQRSKTLAALGQPKAMARLLQNRGATRRWIQALLILGSLALLAVMMARPQWGSTTQTVERKGVSLVLVLDVSKSMLATDNAPNRLAFAKFTLTDLLKKLTGDEVGLVIFAGDAITQVPVTSDYAAVQTAIENASYRQISRQGTALGQALQVALAGFNWQTETQKVILLCTDAEYPASPATSIAEAIEVDPNLREALQMIQDRGARLYAFGFGTPQGAPVPAIQNGLVIGDRQDSQGQTIFTKLSESLLNELTERGNGAYWRATPVGAEIGAFYSEIQAMQQGKIEASVQEARVERFQWFGGLAFLGLVGAAWLGREW